MIRNPYALESTEVEVEVEHSSLVDNLVSLNIHYILLGEVAQSLKFIVSKQHDSPLKITCRKATLGREEWYCLSHDKYL
jgi:hypothetical protein